MMSITGEITRENECVYMTTLEGSLYVLTGNTTRLEDGDSVTIWGFTENGPHPCGGSGLVFRVI